MSLVSNYLVNNPYTSLLDAAVSTVDRFDQDDGLENMKNKCGELKRAFLNFSTAIRFSPPQVASFNALNKLKYVSDWMHSVYRELGTKSAFRLSNRLIAVTQSLDLASEDTARKIADLSGKLDRFTTHLASQIKSDKEDLLANIIAWHMMQYPSFQSKNFKQFLDTELYSSDLIQLLNTYDTTLDWAGSYRVISQTLNRVFDYLRVKCPKELQDRCVEGQRDIQFQVLHAFLYEYLSDCEEFENIIKSDTVEEFSENIHSYAQVLYSLNLNQLLTDWIGEPLPERLLLITTGINDLITKKILSQMGFGNYVDEAVSKILLQLSEDIEGLSEKMKKRFNVDSLPNFEQLPESMSTSVIYRPDPSLMTNKPSSSLFNKSDEMKD